MRFSIVGFLISLQFTACAEAEQQCLPYGPAAITLSGRVIHRQAYGEPGYGEDPAHDAIERYEALKLDQPVCVVQKGKDEVDVDEKDVSLVQLVFLKPTYSAAANVHVWVTGTLFHGITGHHHTTILIQVEKVERRNG